MKPSFALLDGDGFVLNQASLHRIPAHWRPAVKAALDRCVLEVGDQLHSIYVRGSVVNGGVIDNVSDVDFILLTRASPEERRPAWLAQLDALITERFPFVCRLEILVAGVDEVAETPFLRVMIKTQAVCMYGDDIGLGIAKLKPGLGMLVHCYDIRRGLERNKRFFAEARPVDARLAKCRTIMRRIVRTGFELVMEETSAYTRELETCLAIFSRFYPDRAVDMEEVFELAIQPTADPNRVVPLLENIGEWTACSAEKLLLQYQLVARPLEIKCLASGEDECQE